MSTTLKKSPEFNECEFIQNTTYIDYRDLSDTDSIIKPEKHNDDNNRCNCDWFSCSLLCLSLSAILKLIK